MADTGRKSENEGRRSGEERRISRRGENFPSFFMRPSELFPASPFSLMRRFMDEIERGFGTERGGAESRFWAPAIEVREKDNNLVVCADLPGLKKDEVKLDITDEGLVIQGERKQESEEEREGVRRTERSYGQFYRLIPLPEEARVQDAKARFNNGVLEVTIPIPESSQRRRSIPIEAGGTEEPRKVEPGKKAA